ncbi:MAG: acyltransferase family protein [Peptoclostridium sp.]|uniref:acyltransferase n=1 Tax=Peptoclostridium sp. TaxID=1904860 RepID=UPI00139B1FFD|nr:acyltransferase [Peptoclostridium sp.]MZQ75749.1 acyltransferase family protein [Peptoclostridium sp.]
MEKKRDYEIDALKGFACITVVFLHVFRGKEYVDVFIGEIGRWAVPAFFMVQGFYMGRSALKPWLDSAIGKFKKIYIPFLFYSLAYGVYFYYYDGKAFTFSDVLLGETAVHLYYVIHYMIFALTIPLLYMLPKLYMKYFMWFMVISNFALCTILEIQRFSGIRIITYSGINPLKWWGFVALGMLAAESPRLFKYIRENRNAAVMISTALAAIGTLLPYLTGRTGYFYNRASLFPLAIGMTLLIIALYQKEKMPGKDVLLYISQRSFGIYLIHFFIVHVLKFVLGIKTLWLVAILTMVISILILNLSKTLKSELLMRS